MAGYIFITQNEEDVVLFIQGMLSPSSLIKCITLTEEEYAYFETRLFDYINVECNILIDKFEEETLELADIPKAIEIVKLLINNTDDCLFIEFANKFLELLEFAITNGKSVEFKF